MLSDEPCALTRKIHLSERVLDRLQCLAVEAPVPKMGADSSLSPELSQAFFDFPTHVLALVDQAARAKVLSRAERDLACVAVAHDLFGEHLNRIRTVGQEIFSASDRSAKLCRALQLLEAVDTVGKADEQVARLHGVFLRIDHGARAPLKEAEKLDMDVQVRRALQAVLLAVVVAEIVVRRAVFVGDIHGEASFLCLVWRYLTTFFGQMQGLWLDFPVFSDKNCHIWRRGAKKQDLSYK